MCGIVGIVGLGGTPVDLGVLQRMNDLQAHRGPDGEGFLVAWRHGERFAHARLAHTAQWDRRAAVQVALGHRRLAILDLSERGLQPMSMGDTGVWIAFNGEIYNHRELPAELEARGGEFTTRTDTEGLRQADLRWGHDCRAHVHGKFAFASLDGP